MNKYFVLGLLSASVVLSGCAGDKFSYKDKALHHQDTYTITKLDVDNTYDLKKESNFGDFQVIKKREVVIADKKENFYAPALHKPIVKMQSVTKVPTDPVLIAADRDLNRTPFKTVVVYVLDSKTTGAIVSYSVNEALARAKFKDGPQTFKYVDHRDAKGKQDIQKVYGVEAVKKATAEVLALRLPTYSFFSSNAKKDTTKALFEVQSRLDKQYPDIFEVKTIQRY